MKKLTYSIIILISFILLTFVMDAILRAVPNNFSKVGGGVGEVTTSVAVKEIPIVETVVGEEYGFIYRNNTTGKEETFITTKSNFENNLLKQPAKKGYTYVGSYGGRPIIATSSPVLNDGEYYIKGYDQGKQIRVIKELGTIKEEIVSTSTIK